MLFNALVQMTKILYKTLYKTDKTLHHHLRCAWRQINTISI